MEAGLETPFITNNFAQQPKLLQKVTLNKKNSFIHVFCALVEILFISKYNNECQERIL